MHTVTGKVALVTGGGQGIGLGIALSLARAGAHIALSGRSEDKLRAAAKRIEEVGVHVLTVTADVRQRASAQRSVTACIERFGRLDILVNNAQSLIVTKPLEELDDEQISATLESGLLGTVYHMQAAFEQLKKHRGCVVNISSREAIVGGKGFSIYAATKAGIRALSKTAAREWGPHGIRVNVINPVALSPAGIEFVQAHPEESKEYLKDIALGRFGDPIEDIGPVAAFLASDAARYVTGQTICADGGQVML